MNHTDKEYTQHTLLDSIEQTLGQQNHEEYTGHRTLKGVNYKQPFSKVYAKEIENLKGWGAFIAVVTSIFLLAYIHFMLTANPHEKIREVYLLYVALWFILSPVCIAFGFCLYLWFKAIKQRVRTFKKKQRIRLLPLTEEERKQNNLNSFLAYSSWLTHNFSSDDVLTIDEWIEGDIRKTLESLFRKDFHIDSKYPMFVSFLYSEDYIKEGYYRLTENIYLYIEEYEEIGERILVFLYFK